jgi:hypothetical protein
LRGSAAASASISQAGRLIAYVDGMFAAYGGWNAWLCSKV